MSEYICERSDEPAKVVRDGWTVRIEWDFKQREEIVRCRDCKYYKPWVLSRPENGGDCVLNKVEVDVWFDGFCAWGKRREK